MADSCWRWSPTIKRQNVSPRPGIEPGSPAIHMERGRLLTGGYTDHYTNEDLLIGKRLTLQMHRYLDSKTHRKQIFFTEPTQDKRNGLDDQKPVFIIEESFEPNLSKTRFHLINYFTRYIKIYVYILPLIYYRPSCHVSAFFGLARDDEWCMMLNAVDRRWLGLLWSYLMS